jgi:hypothetical protein
VTNLNDDDGMSRLEGKCYYLITISKHSNLWLRRLMPDMNDPSGLEYYPPIRRIWKDVRALVLA